MVIIFNAMLYVIALSLSLAIITPVGEGASRRVRAMRWVLACSGGVAITIAIALSFMGQWFQSGLIGAVAIVFVGAGMWLALWSGSAADNEGDDDGDDGGGGQRKPKIPPAPPEPLGDPPYDPWTEFDRARAGWEREPVGA